LFLWRQLFAGGVARAVSGEQVDWFSVLSAEPDWPQRCRRARRKQQILTRSSEADYGDTDWLFAWFFGDHLGWPNDLDAFLRERAWTDVHRLAKVAAREAAFVTAD
jgi:hypothetical protein